MDEPASVSDDGSRIELKDGGCIYELVAKWTGSEFYHGVVHYAFHAGPGQDADAP